MSKKHGKAIRPNPNRARSKNNPNGKRNDPRTNWPEYNKGRSQEGELFVHWMTQITIFARGIMNIVLGTRDRRVSAILMSILKSKENLSCWGLTNHFVKYPVYLERCELSRQHHTSWYHLRVSEIWPAVLQKIITMMAGNRAVHGTLLTDSSGFGVAKCIDWQNAKYGSISVRLFTKLHLMHTLHGMMCAATVTPGNSNDSPHLRAMVKTLPEDGGDVLADAAYGGVKNCNAIVTEAYNRPQVKCRDQGIQRAPRC